MQSDMDLQNAGNFKYYKCRSLLACDTGGMVFDTSASYHNTSCANNNLRCTDENKSESGQLESIIYIVDVEQNHASKSRSLVDSTTHLDDDEFNEREMHSNTSCKVENKVTSLIPAEDTTKLLDLKDPEHVQAKNFDYFCIDNEDNQKVQELVEQILKNDEIFVSQDSECITDCSLSTVTYLEDSEDNTRKDSFLKDICSSQEVNFQYLTSSFQIFDSSDLTDLGKQEINEYENDPSMKNIKTMNTNLHKRKQIYSVRNDLFTESFDAKSDKIKVSTGKNKKKKLISNRGIQKEKSQYQKKNPFENVKLSSILKGNKLESIKKSKNQCKKQRRESVTSSQDENFESHNIFNSKETAVAEKEYCQKEHCFAFNVKDNVLQNINVDVNINLELTNADYFEYVQPRERVIESDMDKLLSPCIEIESCERLDTCKVQQLIEEKQGQIDYNGNEVHFQDIKETNKSKTVLSPCEIAERQLFLKSAYAKQLGYKNYFNTSNEYVIDEILYDQTLAYQQIKLDVNFISNVEICANQNELLDKSFNSVSCTLLESLNEFNRFGGFAEENSKKEDPNHTIKDSSVILIEEVPANSYRSEKLQKHDFNSNTYHEMEEKKYYENKSDYSFNFSNKSNLLGFHLQSRHASLEYLNTADIDNESSPSSLVIKIKRVNDENKYVIDDSNRQNINYETIVNKSTENLNRYECFYCSEKCRTKRILKNHVSKYHRGPYDTECELCHTKFKKSSAHKKHQPWCQRNVIHKCDFCNKVYCYHASLIKHLKTHRQ